MTRQNLFGTTMWLAVAATGVLACDSSEICRGERCDILVVLATADADILLPPLTVQSVGTEVSDLLFLKLAEIGPELNTVDVGSYEARLASDWRRLDSLRLEFTLDERAVWGDGTPVSPADVVFSFAVYSDTLVGSRFAGQLETIDSVLPTGERSVVFHFSHPYPEQFYDATQHVRILPGHLLEAIPRDSLAVHPFSRAPVGNGPYKFVRWEPDQFIELRANEEFFLGEPPITRIFWRTSIADELRRMMLITGEGDVIGTVTNELDRRDLEGRPGITVVDYASPVYSFVAFNFRDPEDLERPHPILSDESVRRAVAMAVDRPTLVSAIFGEDAQVALGPISRLSWLWRPDLTQIPFDTSGARSLLDASGWVDSDGDGSRQRDGRELRLRLIVPSSSTGRMNAATVMQEQLRLVGVRLDLVPLEFNAFLAAAQDGRFDAVFSAFLVDPSPSGLRDLWSEAGHSSNNWGGYVNALADSLMATAVRTTDGDAAQVLWRRVVDLVVADIPAVWIAEPALSAAVSARVETTQIRPDRWAADIWRWRLRSGAVDVSGSGEQD